ncbi:MAG: hypothetical protein ACOYXR_09790 [Nitrospirota bacterium]
MGAFDRRYAVCIAGIALGQSALLVLLPRVVGDDYASRTLWYTLAVGVPLFLQLTLVAVRDLRIWAYAGLFGLLLAPLAVHVGGAIDSPGRAPAVLIPFTVAMAAAGIVLSSLVRAALTVGSWRLPYPLVCRTAWQTVFTAVIAAWTALTYAVVGQILFVIIWFIAAQQVPYRDQSDIALNPINALSFGLGVIMCRTYEPALHRVYERGARNLPWLLPVLAVALLAFTASMSLALLAPPWHGSGAPLILPVALLAVLGLNASYPEGRTGDPLHRWVHAGRTATTAILPVGLALYGYWITDDAMRSAWTWSAVTEILCVTMLALYAFGYLIASVVGPRHGPRFAATNYAAAAGFLALIFVIHSPYLDLRCVIGQYEAARLRAGAIAPGAYPYAEVATDWGKEGLYEIVRLSYFEGPPHAEEIRRLALDALNDVDCLDKDLPAGPAPALTGSGPIYFAPVGDFPREEAFRLADLYRGRYHITATVLPSVSFEGEDSPFDWDREQVIAEALLDLVRRRHATPATEHDAVLIALTDQDMYIRGRSWRYAFSWRDTDRTAVVSSARMDPRFFGEPANPALAKLRLQKMVVRHIGRMYYYLPASNSRNSVLCSPVNGLEDLDSLAERF